MHRIARVALLAVGVGLAGCLGPGPGPTDPQPPEQATCATDARLCADGSTVARFGPDCEFAPCPGETPDEDRGLAPDPAPPIGPDPDPEPLPPGPRIPTGESLPG